MNEVVALLVDSTGRDETSDLRVQSAAVALGQAVLARGGRLLVFGDGPTVALLTVVAAEYRTVQGLETAERRVAPLIVAGHVSADRVEDDLFTRDGADDGDELSGLERFGLVERVRIGTAQSLGEAYARYDPAAVFLFGDAQRLEGVARVSGLHHRETQTPLFTLDETPWTDGWRRVEGTIDRFSDWRPTVDGVPVEGVDAEVAAEADRDAAIALALEAIVDEMLAGPARLDRNG